MGRWIKHCCTLLTLDLSMFQSIWSAFLASFVRRRSVFTRSNSASTSERRFCCKTISVKKGFSGFFLAIRLFYMTNVLPFPWSCSVRPALPCPTSLTASSRSSSSSRNCSPPPCGCHVHGEPKLAEEVTLRENLFEWMDSWSDLCECNLCVQWLVCVFHYAHSAAELLL